MKSNRYNIWNETEYNYALAFGFIPNIVSYIHEDDVLRPCMIVVPGGGYALVSPTEGEIVAKEFYGRGYNAFVLTYTTDCLYQKPLGMQPLQDMSRAVRYIRKRAEEFHIIGNEVYVCGFSAGAHLCGSLCVHYEDLRENDGVKSEIIAEDDAIAHTDGRTEMGNEYANISNRPDAAILSYPVITAGEKAHRGSFVALLGKKAPKEKLDYFSLELHVTEDTPPMFLWQTATDETVPVEHSYLMAKALKEKNVPFAHHVFSHGIHGLTLANEQWANADYGEPYTLEQMRAELDALAEGKMDVAPRMRELIMQEISVEKFLQKILVPREVNEEVRIWPELADTWIRRRREG